MGWGGSRGRLVPAHVDQHLLLHLGHSNGERGTLDYAKVAVALRGANSVGCSQAPQGTYANMGATLWSPPLPVSYLSMGSDFSEEANVMN